MSKILITIASAALFASSSIAFAADSSGSNNGANRGAGVSGMSDHGGATNAPLPTEQRQMIDQMPTGSINNCDSQQPSEAGNCADPMMQ